MTQFGETGVQTLRAVVAGEGAAPWGLSAAEARPGARRGSFWGAGGSYM